MFNHEPLNPYREGGLIIFIFSIMLWLQEEVYGGQEYRLICRMDIIKQEFNLKNIVIITEDLDISGK